MNHLNSGKSKVWCLYPNKNAVPKSVQDAFGQGSSKKLEQTETMVD